MVFNSIEFALFLPVVFILYWFVLGRNLKAQNASLFVASYVFYAFWDWRLVLVLFGISISTYLTGLHIEKNRDKKAAITAKRINVLLGISVLFLFKYYNFFAGEFSKLFLRGESDKLFLNLVLPVGLSFYVLRSISYTIEVAKNKIPVEKDIISLLTYISFFPQLLSGPIARPGQFLPQLNSRRTFTYENGSEGLRQILWGLFKKVVVADNCAIYVDSVFNNISVQSGSTIVLTAIYTPYRFTLISQDILTWQ